jgi:hypothetical protein
MELPMRIPRSLHYVLLPAFLCYYAAVANASLPGRGQPTRAVAALPEVVTEAVDSLRATIATSGLMRDTRPSPAEEQRDFVALWADLQPHHAGIVATQPEPSADYPELVPGQD